MFLFYISAFSSVTRWRLGHSIINFSQQLDYLVSSFFRYQMCLCLPENLWKFELVWISRLKIEAKIDDVTRWWRMDKKLRVTCLFFILLRMCARLKEMFHRRFVADSLRYPTEKRTLQRGFLFWRGIGLINVTRWWSRNAMTMISANKFFSMLGLLYV